MALVIEDGTGVPSANSYISLAQARAYATDRGVTLSADDTVLTPLVISACDYLETFALYYVGRPAYVILPGHEGPPPIYQSLSWPRKGVLLSQDCWLPSNVIPQKLIDAQCQAVIEENNGVVLLPTTDPSSNGGFVLDEKVGELEVRYSEKIGTTSEPRMPAVDALLMFLLWSRNMPGALKTVRV